MQLTNETISMLRLFTEALADAFTTQEIVQRLADMLDYNLKSMAGQKQRDLKVDNPEQFGFKPLNLLDDLLSVYLHLREKPNFVLAVARDERSYDFNIFKHAAGIVGSKSLKSPQELAQFTRFLEDVEGTKLAMGQEEEWMGEVPDEYMDPLMFTIMEDPVILPISKQIIDRGTIRQHLLSDPHDPFNRTPLKIEDVIPATEIKEKIEAFRAEAREKARRAIEEKKAGTEGEEKKAGTEGEEKMDTADEADGSLVESNLALGGVEKRKADEELEGQGRGDKMDLTE
jgi:ubiquitin conjugation factor E4 B